MPAPPTPKEKDSKTKIFENMSYELDEDGYVDISSLLEWIKSKDCVLATEVNGKRLETGRSPEVELKLSSVPLDICFLQKKDCQKLKSLCEYFARWVDGKEIQSDEQGRASRLQGLNALIKRHSRDLVLLEAFAARASIDSIRKYDEPTWVGSTEGEIANQMFDQMLISGKPEIVIRISRHIYSLRNLLPVLSACVQANGLWNIRLQVADNDSVEALIPIMFLIDAVNRAKLLNMHMNTFVLDWQQGSLGLLESAGIGGLSSQTLLAGNVNLPRIAPISGALDLPMSVGRSVHYVVDSSSDLASTVPSLIKKMWLCGAGLNHRCRQLLFVHQSIQEELGTAIRKKLEHLIYDTLEPWSGCDWIQRYASPTKVVEIVRKLGAKIIVADNRLCTDLTYPTIVCDIGTSSELVALKEPGLGHIIVLIPYRTNDELFALGNNSGDPDQLNIYSSCVTNSTNMAKRLNGREILINDGTTNTSLGLQWMFVTKGVHSLEADAEPMTKNKMTTVSLKECKRWADMSSRDKVAKLNELADENRTLPILLSRYYGAASQSWCIQDPPSSGVSALILSKADGVPPDMMVTALTALTLRGKPVVIAVIGSDFPHSLAEKLKVLPEGLVIIINCGSVNEAICASSQYDILWMIQGPGCTMELNVSSLSSCSAAKVFLVNNHENPDVLLNAEKAINSSFKKCYL